MNKPTTNDTPRAASWHDVHVWIAHLHRAEEELHEARFRIEALRAAIAAHGLNFDAMLAEGEARVNDAHLRTIIADVMEDGGCRTCGRDVARFGADPDCED